jgi:hypothetical protein
VKQLGFLSIPLICGLPLLVVTVQGCSATDGGSPATRGTSGAAGMTNGASGAADHAGSGGAGMSAGGSATSGGGAGAGVSGSSAGGSTAGGVGTTGSSGAAGAAAGAAGLAGSGGAPAACPANAFFCSGFEDAGLPTGATYLSNASTDYTSGAALDKTIFHGGTQSIKILQSTSYSQREIVVPAAVTFWFRVYLQTDVMIGGLDGANHNTFLEAAYPGGDKGVEIVEEDCELGMNINDSRYGSNNLVNQPGCPTTPATQLAANTWQCIEGYFDGTKGDFRLFANGTEVITQTGVAGAKQGFSTLRFGYREYHPHDRNVWYDDLVTAPDRINCQ